MPIEILMPALSPTMTEGNVTKWLKKEGDEVHSGDVLAEIETDKATMEFEAVDDGRLGKILVPEGAQGIKVNQPIAVLLGEGEDASALDKWPKSRPRHPWQRPASPSRAPAGGRARAGRPSRRPGEGGNGKGRIFASPLARRMAQQAGLDLAAITGSGPQGRIVKADIEARFLPNGGAPAHRRPATSCPAAPRPHRLQRRLCPRSGCWRSPAIRLTPSGRSRDAPRHRSAADRIEADGSAFLSDRRLRDRRALKFRAELNAKSDAYRISVNDFVIRAAALALRQVPAANASWSDEAILLWERSTSPWPSRSRTG